VGAVKDTLAYRNEQKGIRLIHLSEPIPTAPVVTHNSLPPSVSKSFENALRSLEPNDADERSDWNETFRYGFVPASDEDYDVVRRMIARAQPSCTMECHKDLESYWGNRIDWRVRNEWIGGRKN
jgi:ABC-type phosphate/phosphonate transport system substrate-binding protein